MSGDGRTEGAQRFDDAPCVLRGRLDEDIEIAGRARDPVGGERVRADDQELDLGRGERAKEIDEIVVQLRSLHDPSRRGRASPLACTWGTAGPTSPTRRG